MDYPPTCQPTTCLSVFKLITKKTHVFLLRNIGNQMECCHQLQTLNQTTNRDESDHHSTQPLNYNTLLVGLHLATFHPMSALETLTKNTKKKTSQKAQLLGHLNATTFSQFLKTICAPGHRSITWNARLRSPCLGPIRNPNVSRQAPTNSLLGHAKYTSLYADSNLPCSYLYKFSCRSLEVHHCVAKMVYDDDFSHQSPRYVVFPSSLEVQRLEVQRNQSS